MSGDGRDARPSFWGRELPGERLEDDDLILEPLASSDVPEIVACVPPGECGLWGPVPGPLDEAAAAALVDEWESGRRRGERLAWTGRTRSTGRLTCGVVLMLSSADEAELAYWTAPAARGNGYATRALVLATDWALGRLALRRVWLEIEPGHAASRRVAARAGYRETAEKTRAELPTSAAVAAAGASARCPREFVVHERLRLSGPPQGYAVRAASLADAEAVYDLVRRCELHDLGDQSIDLEELRSEWQSMPGFSLEHDTWVLERLPDEAERGSDVPGSGQRTPAAAPKAGPASIVGYAWFQNERDHELVVGDHCVALEERGRGLGTVLMDRLEDRARREADLAPAKVAQMGVFAVSTHPTKPELFRTRGYRKVREFHRLQIALDREPDAPEWPSGISIRPFRAGIDSAALHDVLDDSFSEHFRDAPMTLPDWEKLYVGNPRSETDLWLLAWDGADVAGACMNFRYPLTGIGYVDQLGVRRAWRRRGLGTALLLASLRLLRERGCRRAVLGVDAENVTGAGRIYERIGMRPQWRTDFYEKTVRPPLP